VEVGIHSIPGTSRPMNQNHPTKLDINSIPIHRFSGPIRPYNILLTRYSYYFSHINCRRPSRICRHPLLSDDGPYQLGRRHVKGGVIDASTSEVKIGCHLYYGLLACVHPKDPLPGSHHSPPHKTGFYWGAMLYRYPKRKHQWWKRKEIVSECYSRRAIWDVQIDCTDGATHHKGYAL